MGELSSWRGLGGRGVAVGSLAASAVIVAAGAVARGPAHPPPSAAARDQIVAGLTAGGRRFTFQSPGPRRAGTSSARTGGPFIERRAPTPECGLRSCAP